MSNVDVGSNQRYNHGCIAVQSAMKKTSAVDY
jgi:hypothetical protein